MISPVVLDELMSGRADRAAARLAVVQSYPLLPVTTEVRQIAAAYVQHRLMPARLHDAVHLALASYHGCSLIASWDEKHLANPNKAQHIRHINRALGLPVPVIATPQALIEHHL